MSSPASSSHGSTTELVKPTPQLSKITKVVKSRRYDPKQSTVSEKEYNTIHAHFPKGSNTYAPSSVVRMTPEQVYTLAPNRVAGFFDSSDTVLIPPIYCRLFYKEADESFFVYFMKKTTERNKSDSHMKISAFELPQLILYLDKVMEEIRGTALFDTIPSLQNPHASDPDMRSENHFHRDFAFHTPSGKLRCRPLRSETGLYQFRFHLLKQSDISGWNGPIITISRIVTEKLLGQFRKYFLWLQGNASNNVKVYSETPSDIESCDEFEEEDEEDYDEERVPNDNADDSLSAPIRPKQAKPSKAKRSRRTKN